MKESRYNVWVERDGASFVFNGVSGSLLRVAEADRQGLVRFLADQTTTDCSRRLLEEMAIGRMLVPDGDELALLETATA